MGENESRQAQWKCSAAEDRTKLRKFPVNTKIGRVARHLEAGYPITPLTALRLYHSFALKDIICKLRRSGYDIITEVVENEETGARFGKYQLNKMSNDGR